MAVALVVSMIVGCQKTSENSVSSTVTSSEDSKSTSTENKDQQTEVSAGPSEISMMTFDFEGSPITGDHADQVITELENYTNTKVDFTWVPDDSYEDKLGLTLASPDDMPMIIAVGKMTSAITSASEAGAFWNLNDYMFDSEKYPNLSQANKKVCESLTVGGELIGIYRARDIGRFGIGYRSDWAEALGISEPKTVEDLYNMMYAFTYDDPDGNGENDTYGLAMCKYTGPFDLMQTYFGVGNGWVEKDGQLIPVHQTEEYLEALNWFKKIYDDGLIYEDWAVRDTATWKDSVKNGECGMFIDVLDGSRSIWDYFISNNISACPGSTSFETAAMNLSGTINGKTMATSGFNGFFVITKAAKTEADLEACLHFLDKMCDDEMLTLSSYGLKDIHWNLDADGFLVDLDKDDAVSVKAYGALNQTVAYIPNMAALSVPLLKTDSKILEEKVKEDNIQYAIFNPVTSYLINSETYSLNGANLDQIITDARTQFVCGEIDIDGLKAAWKNWDDQGGTDVITEVNVQR